MPLNPWGLDVISQLKKYHFGHNAIGQASLQGVSKKNSTEALYDKWSTPTISSPSLTKCHLPMSFPFFSSADPFSAFLPPLACLGFGFQDSETQDHINTFLEPPPPSVNISMTCFTFFSAHSSTLWLSVERESRTCVCKLFLDSQLDLG